MGRNVTASTESAFLTVPTSIGFTAGDLVYNQTGGYGRISDTAVSTATFPLGATGVPVLSSNATNQAQITWAEYAGTSSFTNGAAAKLPNGNIVIPYALNATQAAGTFPYFRVVDSTGATVVAQTQVDTTNRTVPAQTPILGALALPNGNFVVYYRYNNVTTPRLAFRIFNSSGVAQTAVIVDATMDLVTSTNPNLDIRAAARSDSSFVIVGFNASNSPFYRVYNGTTGATVYSNTWGSTSYAFQNGCIDVVVRSDNSWVMVQLGSSSTVRYEVRSATNVQTVASSYSTGYTTSGVCAVLMAGDAVRFILGANSSLGTNLLTGTTIGTEGGLYTYNPSAGGNASQVNAYAYDSGTKFIVIVGANGIGGGYATAGTGYVAFSSGLAQLSAGTTTIPLGMFTGTVSSNPSFFTFFEVDNTIRCYKSVRSVVTSAATALSGAGVAYATIDKTTLLPVNQQSAPYALGNSGALAVSGYVAASSTPTQAFFLASASSSQTVSLAQSTTLLSQTVVESVACNSAQVASLPNGQFAYLYKTTASPFTIKLAIYNSTGIQTNIVTVDTGSSVVNGARMTVLSNGKIMVIYVQGTAVLCKVYSSALVQLASTQITANTAASGVSYGPSISALGVAGRAVVGYTNNSGYPNYAVCDDAGVVINTAQITALAATQLSVCGSRTDTFIFSFTGGAGQIHAYYATSSTVYTQLSSSGGIPLSNPPYGVSSDCGPDNLMMLCPGGNTSGAYIYTVDGGSINLASGSATSVTGFYNSTFNHTLAVGYTATNVTLIFTTTYNNTAASIYYSVLVPANITSPRSAVQITGLSCSTTNSCPSIAPFISDSCVVSLLNASNFPTFFAFAPYASTQYAAITSGSTVSNAVTLSSANRFSLVGVAVTTAAPGATGIIQTKGNAQLSSSYSSSTSYQPFDFRNQTAFGVAGSINGRILTLEN